MFHQVLRVRCELLKKFRQSHGARIKKDQSAETAVQLSLGLRLNWATGAWLESLREVANFFTDKTRLLEWGVILTVASGPAAANMAERAPAAAAAENALGPDAAEAAGDEFLVSTFEAIARVFWGLHARNMCLWSGGIYVMAGLCSKKEAVIQQVVRRAEALHYRCKALARLLESTACPAGVKDFEAQFLWRHGVIYQELLSMIAHGHLDRAKVYAWQIHSSIAHEKGFPVAW